MRVAHLVIGGTVAGGQLVALRLARGLRERGGEPLVLAPAPGPFTELLEAEGIPVRLLPPGRTLRLDRAVRLALLLRRERVDLLHTHTMLAGNVHARLGARLAGVPVVSHMHIENHFRSRPLVRGLQRTLDNLTARLAARIVAVSEGTREALSAQGYPGDRLVAVPNGIETDERPATDTAATRRGLGLPEDAPLVAHVGRLCEVKGQRELIGAAALLGSDHPDLRIVLVGEDVETGGAYRRGLAEEAAALGVAGRVVFAGYRGDVPAILDAVDVLALPSRVEGLPLVLLEAMAAGKPVVASPVGGTPELVLDGETGLHVPPGDEAALARALGRLLDDPDLARRLGRAGRERVVQRYSADTMVDRILEIYEHARRRS